jgi:hypothetical protein
MSEFRNTSFWAYTCDGNGNGYYIDDGGNDMYDEANFTTPWLLSGVGYVTDADTIEDYPYAINYENTTQTITDSTFNYVSLGIVFAEDTDEPAPDTSRHPLTVIGFRCAGPVGWQVGGGLGADGDGDISSNILYNGDIINGFTVYAAYRQVYNAGDPSVCNLIILLGRPEWESVFGSTNAYSDTDTNSNGFYYYSDDTSKNIMGIHTVLSKPSDETEEDPDLNSTTPIPVSELQAVVSNFTLRINQSLGL